MKKSTLLESNQSDYIAFAGDSATFEEFLSKVKENGLEGEFTEEELKKIYTENKPETKKEGLSPYGDDAYLVAPNKAKMKKEDILKAIKEVLTEAEVHVISKDKPQEDKKRIKDAMRKAGVSNPQAYKDVDNLKPDDTVTTEDHHEDPNDESDMAKTQLYATAKYAIELLKMIQDGTQLDAWVQSKITKAADYIDSVKHYMEGEMYLAGTEAPGMEDEPVEEKLDPVGKEDSDINNDGKVDKTDKYLKNKRVKIGQAIAQHKKK